MRQGVAHEVDAAALPDCAEEIGDGRIYALMGIGDHELHAAQAPASRAAQEVGPEGLALGLADRHAEHFAATVTVDAHGDVEGDRHYPACPPHLDVTCIHSVVWPIAFDWPLEEGLRAPVNFSAESADLALRDAAHVHCLDQIIDRSYRDILNISFLSDSGQRFFGHPPGLKNFKEVTALSQLGDAQLNRARPGLPVAISVSIALSEALDIHLAVNGAG